MSRARRTDAVAAADGLCRDGGRVLGCGPMPWQQLGHVLGRMRSKPGEDVAEPGGPVDAWREGRREKETPVEPLHDFYPLVSDAGAGADASSRPNSFISAHSPPGISAFARSWLRRT